MSGPRASGRLGLRFADEGAARAVAAALAPENEGHVHARVEGSMVVVEVDPAALASLLASVDDVITCARAAAAGLCAGVQA